jgi:hypothetical protein
MFRRTVPVVTLLLVLAATLPLAARASAAPSAASTRPATASCGPPIPSRDEPSHHAPLAASAVPGYSLAYCNDFTGSSLPWGWDKFSGAPKGDPSSYFEPSHVVVQNGVVKVETYRDPRRANDWATGGICQCGAPRTHGAFFVRSRSVGEGPDNVELLWPVAKVWPPEVDFNESRAYPLSSTWTVHYAPGDQTVEHQAEVNLWQWHTWGVFWTPKTLTFTVDGFIWGKVKSRRAIPTGPMTLDIQSQTYCGIAPECPTAAASLQVDWVEEFAAK